MKRESPKPGPAVPQYPGNSPKGPRFDPDYRPPIETPAPKTDKPGEIVEPNPPRKVGN